MYLLNKPPTNIKPFCKAERSDAQCMHVQLQQWKTDTFGKCMLGDCGLSAIHRTLTWTTGTLSLVCDLFACIYCTHGGTFWLSCCLTSTEAGWPIRDGDRVGRGQGDWLDRGNRPKKTGETVDRRQNNGSVKAVSPRHCPATCALYNCSFNCCAGQSH